MQPTLMLGVAFAITLTVPIAFMVADQLGIAQKINELGARYWTQWRRGRLIRALERRAATLERMGAAGAAVPLRTLLTGRWTGTDGRFMVVMGDDYPGMTEREMRVLGRRYERLIEALRAHPSVMPVVSEILALIGANVRKRFAGDSAVPETEIGVSGLLRQVNRLIQMVSDDQAVSRFMLLDDSAFAIRRLAIQAIAEEGAVDHAPVLLRSLARQPDAQLAATSLRKLDRSDLLDRFLRVLDLDAHAAFELLDDYRVDMVSAFGELLKPGRHAPTNQAAWAHMVSTADVRELLPVLRKLARDLQHRDREARRTVESAIAQLEHVEHLPRQAQSTPTNDDLPQATQNQVEREDLPRAQHIAAARTREKDH